MVVCTRCGESYLTAETLHEIERIKLHRTSFAKRRRGKFRVGAASQTLEYDEAPKEPNERAVSVDVTIRRDDRSMASPTEHAGERMAAALEKLAASSATASIEDPVAWQREVRRDRPLPGRD